MVSDANLESEFLIRERDLAIRQARAQVAIQIAVLAGCLSILAGLGFPRRVAWTVGVVTAGAVATAYDVRWWLWLRRAEPAEAYQRLQQRENVVGGKRRARMTLMASASLFALWSWLGR